MHIQWDISFGNILTLLLLLVTGVGVYWKHEARIKTLETQIEEHIKVSVPLVKLLQDIDSTMKILSERFGSYPLHRHEGEKILFPPGTQIVEKDLG